MEALEDVIGTGNTADQHGSLAAYLDKFLSAFHELEILVEETYSEPHKKRTLIKSVRGATGMAHLVQKCCDDFSIMTFDAMAQYLRDNSKNVSVEPSSNFKKEEKMVSQPTWHTNKEHPSTSIV
jgi:hypothetical protein